MIPDEVLTVQEVAQLFKVSRVTVWRWCQQGVLPAFKVGRGWRVRRGEVEKMMRQDSVNLQHNQDIKNEVATQINIVP